MRIATFVVVALLAPSYARADEVGDGRAAFVRLCSACHGSDATGGERGPSLIAWRTRPADQFKEVVRKGVPARGMPAFDLTDDQLNQFLAFLRSTPEPRRSPAALDTRTMQVRLRNSRTVEGVIRNQSTFDVQVLDRSGVLHSLKRDEIESIKEAPASTTVEQPEKTSFERIAVPRSGEWPTYNGSLSGNRHSTLSQITPSNVRLLGARWTFPIRESQRLEVTPVVIDGTMYVTTANQVHALDALTGRQIWQFRRDRTKGLAGDAASGINRGVAVLGDRIFLATDNAHLLAINRHNGTLVWDVEMADHRQNYGATAAPLVVNDLVVSGVSGGDEGVRGFLAAYRADTGERVWQFWTVPRPGEPGSETWQGKDIEHGCSGTWLTGTYDAQARILYWTTGNPCPDYNGDERKGDNLYSNSVLALDPETGKLRWYFQFTPHDLHDWDAVQTPVLIDAPWGGKERKLLIKADRNGFFYVLDRLTGEFLLGKPFAKQTWASGLDAKGRPQVLPGTAPTPEGVKVCPAVEGATNWFSTAYNPATQLFYVMALDKCTVYTKTPDVWKAGESFYGGGTRSVSGERGKKALRAISIRSGEIAWEVPQIGPANSWGGILSTASGLLFYGEDSGALAAADARNGKALWHFHTNQSWKASPMTYAVHGKQFVAVAAGGQILAFGLPE